MDFFKVTISQRDQCNRRGVYKMKTYDPKTKTLFFVGLSNQGQSNRAKVFPQTPTDTKSVGLRFIDQAGSNFKAKTLAQMLFSMSTDTKSMGLCFIDQAGSNYKMKTLAQMLSSTSMDTKSMGSSFCRSGRLKPSLKCFVRCQRTQNQWGLHFVERAGSNYKMKTLASLLS